MVSGQVKHNSCVRSRCNRRAPDVFSHIFGAFYMNCSRIIYYFIIVTLVHFLSFLAISSLLRLVRLSFSGEQLNMGATAAANLFYNI